MFKLLRRISYGVYPRPDRPWEEDPTSNAPILGRKRRLSSTERDLHDDDDQASKKKARGESATPSVLEVGNSSPTLIPQGDAEEVKEVTQGVEEVALDEEAAKEASDEKTAPETIPLPEEESGELDEPELDHAPETVAAHTTSSDPEAAALSVAEETPSKPLPEVDDVLSLAAVDEAHETPSSIPATKNSPTKAAATED